MRKYKLIASYHKNKRDDWEDIEKIIVLTKREENLLACDGLQEFLKHLIEIGTLPKGFYHYPCLYKPTKDDLKKK